MFKIVTFEVEVTDGVADSEIKEYLEMTLGCGGCSQDNPLISEDSNCEIYCFNVTVM